MRKIDLRKTFQKFEHSKKMLDCSNSVQQYNKQCTMYIHNYTEINILIFKDLRGLKHLLETMIVSRSELI